MWIDIQRHGQIGERAYRDQIDLLQISIDEIDKAHHCTLFLDQTLVDDYFIFEVHQSILAVPPFRRLIFVFHQLIRLADEDRDFAAIQGQKSK